MKRYALFAGDVHCPVGGMDDLVGRYDSLEMARAAIPAPETYGHQWFHIVDLEIFTITENGIVYPKA